MSNSLYEVSVRRVFIGACAAAAMLTAVGANAASFMGKLNGVACASAGEECPTDKSDPHLSVEADFVLQTSDGKFYFLPNIARATKQHYATETVRIEGEKSPKFDMIAVDSMSVKRDGKFVKVWDPSSSDDAFLKLWSDPTKYHLGGDN